MQRLVLKAAGAAKGSPKILVGFPVPLLKGKTARHIHIASGGFLPDLRQWHHRGFTLMHLCADGALLSSMSSLMLAQRNLDLSAERDLVPENERALADVQTLFCSTPCVAHGIQNSLKWAVSPHSSEETLKGIHIAIESLAFRDTSHDAEEARSLWSALGVEADVLADFVEVHPLWDGHSLWVSQHLEGSEETLSKVTFLLLKVFRWQRFTQTRFLTLGSSTRALLASLLVGLDSLVSITRSDPATTDFHLHGYSGLTTACRRLAVVCAFAAFPAEAGLELLLADDRLALQVPRFRETMEEEWEWLLGIPGSTWTCIATSTAASPSGSDLRSQCLQAALTSLGYVYANALRLFEEEPWKWTQGDTEAHFAVLAGDGVEVHHMLSRRLRTYLHMGGDPQKVRSILDLMRECSFSTMGVEQQHGSYASLHRFHPDLGLKSLSTRGYLHSCRALLHPSERPRQHSTGWSRPSASCLPSNPTRSGDAPSSCNRCS